MLSATVVRPSLAPRRAPLAIAVGAVVVLLATGAYVVQTVDKLS